MSGKAVLLATSSFGDADQAPVDELKRAGLSLHGNPHKRKLTEAEVGELLSAHKPCGMIAGLEPLTGPVLERAKSHLKVISRCGIGMENVDLAAAQRLGIKVFNTPEAPSQAVAELAIGMMLAVLRRIAEADRALRQGTWKALMGSLLGDKTVGVAGHGRIGSRVAQIARGFGCRVIACDERDFSAAGVERRTWHELLVEADVLTLHMPLDERNRHLINAGTIEKMKKGAVLINVSRGGLVDEAALAAALKTERLAGAGIDAFENEPYSGPLKDLSNVVLTPHMGSAAKECRARMELEAAQNLIEGLRAAGEIKP